MAELIFALLSLAALFALAMNRAPLWAWAAAIAVFTLSLQMGLGSGHLHAPVFNVWAVLGWLAAGGLFALTFPRLKHDYVVMPAYRALKGAMPTISETERRGARSRHRRLGRRALLRHAGLVEAPPRQPHHPHR